MKNTEKHLLDLLRETLPYLEFCVGGTDVDETLGKVNLVLFESAGCEHSDRTCTCPCGHSKTCDPCGFYGAEEL